MDPKEQERWQALALEAGRVFTPNTPVDEKSLFTGRVAQIRRVVDVIRQSGQHAIVFGERGVGKTSLANVLHEFLGKAHAQVSAPRINCDSGDTFGTTWRKAFEQVEVTRSERSAGFSGAKKSTTCDATNLLGSGPIRPDSVRRVLTELSRDLLLIVIIDEFDRLPQKTRRAFADTIKTLSDHAVAATVVLVGVADSVEQLVEEHQSVSRALVQIQMPRMTPQEIGTIIDSGLNRLGMTIDVSARERVVLLAQGLPHYAHLIGLHAARYALDHQITTITLDIVAYAIASAIEDAQHSIKTAYGAAIRSARKDNLFREVLLSCALAPIDDLGFFAAADVREPLRKITGKNYDIPSFAQHLNEFSDKKRGRILRKIGERRRYRYRFSDPLMQPLVIMQGVVDDMIPEESLG